MQYENPILLKTHLNKVAKVKLSIRLLQMHCHAYDDKRKI